VKLVNLTTHTDSRGRLTAIEGEADIPFAIQRLFYVYDVASGTDRAGHAHPATQQLLLAMTGSLEVEVTDGQTTRNYPLTVCNIGLYVPPMIWVSLKRFSAGALCLVAASTHYVASDVIREWGDYQTRLMRMRTRS